MSFFVSFLRFSRKSHPCFHSLDVPCIQFHDRNKLMQICTMWLRFSNNVVTKELFKREPFKYWEKNNNTKFLCPVKSGLRNVQNLCKRRQNLKIRLVFLFLSKTLSPNWNWQKIKQKLSNTLRLNCSCFKFVCFLYPCYHPKIAPSKKCTKNKRVHFNENLW